MNNLDKLGLSIATRSALASSLHQNEISVFQKELIRVLSQSNSLQFIRCHRKFLEILDQLTNCIEKSDLENDKKIFFAHQNIVLSYYLELTSLKSCEEFNHFVYILTSHLNNNKQNVMLTFVHYLSRNNNMERFFNKTANVKTRFCLLFKQLFSEYPLKKAKNQSEEELNFYTHLFLFKIWKKISRGKRERKCISQLIIHHMRKINKYSAKSYKLKDLIEAILALMNIQESSNEDEKEIWYMLDTVPDVFLRPVEWIEPIVQRQMDNSAITIDGDVEIIDVEDNYSDLCTLDLSLMSQESTPNAEIISIADSHSDSSTLHLSENTASQKFTSGYESDINSNFSGPERAKLTKSLKYVQTYNSKKTDIMERKDYLAGKSTTSTDCKFNYLTKSMKQKHNENWMLVQNPKIKMRKIDSVEFEALQFKTLPPEYFKRKYGRHKCPKNSIKMKKKSKLNWVIQKR